jgi:hypothetical protein
MERKTVKHGKASNFMPTALLVACRNLLNHAAPPLDFVVAWQTADIAKSDCPEMQIHSFYGFRGLHVLGSRDQPHSTLPTTSSQVHGNLETQTPHQRHVQSHECATNLVDKSDMNLTALAAKGPRSADGTGAFPHKAANEDHLHPQSPQCRSDMSLVRWNLGPLPF